MSGSPRMRAVSSPRRWWSGCSSCCCGSCSSSSGTSRRTCCRSPPPSGEQISGLASDIWAPARYTGSNALVGLLSAAVLGVAVAVLACRVPFFDELLRADGGRGRTRCRSSRWPRCFNTMFAHDVETPRRLVVDDRGVLPGVHQHAARAAQVDPVHGDLMRSYAATTWQRARAVTRCPARCRSSSPACGSRRRSR